MKTILLALSLAVPLTVTCQITLQATTPEPVRSVLSLNEGPKFIGVLSQTVGASTVNIYDTDLSLFRTLVIPAPPEGVHWSSLTSVTETLFDTDPGTVEYMLFGLHDAEGGTLPVLGIYDEDGVELFFRDPGTAFSTVGAPQDMGPNIIETDGGALMLIGHAISGSGVEIYHLPGHVPCISSCGNDGITGIAPMQGTSGTMTVQSPADGSSIVRYTLADGASHGMLELFDAAGRILRTEPIRSDGQYLLDTRTLTGGSYIVRIRTDRKVMSGAPMVVVH